MTKIYFSLLVAIMASFTQWKALAQPCGDPGGGIGNIDLTYGSLVRHLYPATLPAGAPSGSLNRSTVGYLTSRDPMTTTYTQRQITIHPEITGEASGKVVLRLEILDMNAPGANIKIYNGSTATGVALHSITAANSASFVGQNMTFNGAVTLTFQSSVPASGYFDIDIRYMTGDNIITSSLNSPIAYWKKFIQPNSYTLIDNYRTDVIFSGTPFAIAYFDANKNFVSTTTLASDRVFCLDHNLDQPVIGNDAYPGMMNFSRNTRPDINKNGIVNSQDALITARLVWIMKNAPLGFSESNLTSVESAVWTTIDNPNGSYSGLHNNAKTAIPSLPSPIEPTISVTTASADASVGNGIDFTVNFDIAGSHPRRLKVVLPANITLSNLSGATYSGGFLNFGAGPSTATFKVVSSIAQAAKIQFVYEESGFWNVSNVMIYRPCTISGADYQDLIGIEQGATTYPNRSVELTWTPNPVSIALIDFSVTAKNDAALLLWTTASEKNNSGFEVERSTDGIRWTTLGFVNSKSELGNSTEKLSYNFTDNNPLMGKNQYRLKQIDFDGQFEYSKVEVITMNVTGNIRVYPNPMTDFLTIEGVAHNSRISLYNTLGQELHSKTVDFNEKQVRLDVSYLSDGVYYLVITSMDGKVISREKIVKK